MMEFPEKLVEAAIREEITHATKDCPPTKSGAPRPAVDSLVIVLVAIRVKDEIDIKLPDDAMPPGGFDDVEDCVQSILEQCRHQWHKEHQEQGETVS